MHGFCVGKRVPVLGGRLVMDVDGAVADGCEKDAGSVVPDVDDAEDALSVGVASAGVESARLSSEGVDHDVGVDDACEEGGGSALEWNVYRNVCIHLRIYV